MREEAYVGGPSDSPPISGSGTRSIGRSKAQSSWYRPGTAVRIVLSRRERLALGATVYLLPLTLVLLGIWLARDLWPPFRQVTVLFFLGWLLAFMLEPLVSWLVRRSARLPRGLAAAIVFFALAGATIAIGAWVTRSIIESAEGLGAGGTSIVDRVVRSLAPLEQWSESVGYSLDTRALVTDLVDSVETQLGQRVEGTIGGALALVGNGVTIIFIAIVMVASKAGVLLFTRRLVPANQLLLFDRLSAAVTHSFGGFIRGQFGIAAVYGLLVSAVALVFGIPFVPFIGVVTLLLQSIPWFGQLVSWIPLVAASIMFRPEVLLPVAAIMLLGWLMLQNVVSPRVLGSSVGLNPLVVLAAVFIGGAVAGPLGAVFGVPAVAAIASVFTAWLDVVRPARRVPAAPPVRPRARRSGGRARHGACRPTRTSGG
jgi:predicted PurR-regulated permease PerM